MPNTFVVTSYCNPAWVSAFTYTRILEEALDPLGLQDEPEVGEGLFWLASVVTGALLHAPRGGQPQQWLELQPRLTQAPPVILRLPQLEHRHDARVVELGP